MTDHGKRLVMVLIGLVLMSACLAFGESEPRSRTESICNIGMVKGEAKKSCQIPIPEGCTVAQFPGYDEPWVDASKGGGTTCRFDEQKTDWKTSITGTCHECTTERCSGRFSVMFNCADNIPPANPQPATK